MAARSARPTLPLIDKPFSPTRFRQWYYLSSVDVFNDVDIFRRITIKPADRRADSNLNVEVTDKLTARRAGANKRVTREREFRIQKSGVRMGKFILNCRIANTLAPVPSPAGEGRARLALPYYGRALTSLPVPLIPARYSAFDGPRAKPDSHHCHGRRLIHPCCPAESGKPATSDTGARWRTPR